LEISLKTLLKITPMNEVALLVFNEPAISENSFSHFLDIAGYFYYQENMNRMFFFKI